VLKVDFFVLGTSELDAEQMERRDGGGISDRQWRDVLGVLKVQSERLDLAYLGRWAERLGLSDLLSRAADEAGIDEAR